MAGVRIPQINQRVGTPGVALRGGHLNTPSDRGIGDALGNVGEAIGNFQQAEVQRKEDDAAAHSAVALAQAQAEMSRAYREEQAKSKDGAADFPERFKKRFDDYKGKVIAAGATPTAKKYLAERMAALGTHYDEQALGFSAAEGQQYRVDSYRTASDSAAEEIQKDDSLIVTRLAEINAPIDADGSMLPDQKRTAKEYAKNKMALAAAQGRLIRDPYQTRAQLGAKLGMDANSSMPRAQFEAAVVNEASARVKRGDAVDVTDAWIVKQMGRATTNGMVDAPEYAAHVSVSPAFSMLSPDQTVAMYNAADAEVRQREAEARQGAEAGKITFRQQLQDTQTALQNGEVVPIPTEAEAVQFMGPEAGPIAVRQLQVYQSMAGAMTTLKTASPAETAALIEQYKPAGTDNREATQQRYQALIAQAKQVDAERKADPGQYVLNNSKLVADAFGKYAELATVGAQTQEQARALMNANQSYLNFSLAEQHRLGIDKAQLPKAYIEAVQKDFANNIVKDPRGAVARLAQTGALLSHSPFALDQLSSAVGPDGVMAMEGVSPATVQKLYAIGQTPENDRKKLFPTDKPWGDLQKAVNKTFAPLVGTFAAQNDDSTAARYSEAAMRLAYARVMGGETVDQAAKGAYASLIEERYHPITSSYRIPRQYSEEGVKSGIGQFFQSFDAGRLTVTADPGFTLEESAARKWRTVQRGGKWVNNENDSGMYLFGPDGRPVMLKSGPLMVTFDSLMKLKPSTSTDTATILRPGRE